MNLLSKFKYFLEKALSSRRTQQILKANELIKGRVLKDFINSCDNTNDLEIELLKQNLESSTVELIYSNGDHCGCGLLITTDGYFITCYHCVDKYLHLLRIVLSDGSTYSNLKLCDYSKKHDIALVKAPIPVLAEAIKHPFCINKKPEVSTGPILTIVRRDGVLDMINGLSKSHSLQKIFIEGGGFHKKQVNYDCFLRPGDSGGVVVRSSDLKLCGIASSMGTDKSTAYYTKWHNAIEIITRYANSKTGQ